MQNNTVTDYCPADLISASNYVIQSINKDLDVELHTHILSFSKYEDTLKALDFLSTFPNHDAVTLFRFHNTVDLVNCGLNINLLHSLTPEQLSSLTQSAPRRAQDMINVLNGAGIDASELLTCAESKSYQLYTKMSDEMM